MQIQFFSIPVIVSDNMELEHLNRFLRSVKVLEIKRELVSVENGAYWALCITYLPNNEGTTTTISKKVDYKDVLNETAFDIFTRLRKIRKKIAEDDAVPAYAVFTDYELSEIAQADEININVIKQIKGIGIKKIEKYGNKLCEMLINENQT